MCKGIKLNKATVVRAFVKLEEKGVVNRILNYFENCRKNLLSVTDEGKGSIADVVHIYDEWFARISPSLRWRSNSALMTNTVAGFMPPQEKMR